MEGYDFSLLTLTLSVHDTNIVVIMWWNTGESKIIMSIKNLERSEDTRGAMFFMVDLEMSGLINVDNVIGI